MSTVRIPEGIWSKIHAHLYSTRGEHFAFMLAKWTFSGSEPVFVVDDVILVPDSQVNAQRSGWELSTEAIVNVTNAAVGSGSALIEVHNHGGSLPRFSLTDRNGLNEFVPYVLDSLRGRPYAATVWGGSTVYGEFFLPGKTGNIRSITVIGERFRQIVSRDDDEQAVGSAFDRQLCWFAEEGQRALGRVRIGIIGGGGTGSQICQSLVFAGLRDFVIVEFDPADESSMNRLVTAGAADLDTPKGILARRLIKSVAPTARVDLIEENLCSSAALEKLKGVDVIFGCVDNDGARLVLNELALAYRIPYFDIAVGIDAASGKVDSAGGRIAIVLPEGPCLHCMGEIDREEAAFFLSSPDEKHFQIERGYVKGLNVRAPSVVMLNGAAANAAVTEFAVWFSGLRTIATYIEIDLLGVGRARKGQWIAPTLFAKKPGCIQCIASGMGDQIDIERYSRKSESSRRP